MNYAVVHDDFMQFGGAERVSLCISEIFNADIYSSIASDENLLNIKDLKLSFFQKYNFIRKNFKKFFFIYPLAFESFNFDKYNIVISSSTRFAHGVITSPETLHFCYMHSPSRYVWDYLEYTKDMNLGKFEKLLLPVFISYLRVWDYAASQRVDFFIANSRYTQERIKKFYKKDSVVINPPVDIERFIKNKALSGDYYLYVGRIVPWKRLDIVIKAFNENKKELYFVGEGDSKYIKKLKSISKNNIKFFDKVNDKDLPSFYQKCKAVIFPQKEDFGIIPVESLASGKPVIAYGKGGILDIIKDKKTGILFKEQSVTSLNSAIDEFESLKFDSEYLKNESKRFSKDLFEKNIKLYIDSVWKKI